MKLCLKTFLRRLRERKNIDNMMILIHIVLQEPLSFIQITSESAIMLREKFELKYGKINPQ